MLVFYIRVNEHFQKIKKKESNLYKEILPENLEHEGIERRNTRARGREGGRESRKDVGRDISMCLLGCILRNNKKKKPKNPECLTLVKENYHIVIPNPYPSDKKYSSV